MSLNGVSNTVASYSNTKTEPSKKANEKITEKTSEKAAGNTTAKANDSKDTYTPSSENDTDSTKKIYKQDTALVNKLKAEAESRTESLRSLVQKMMQKQGQSYTNATDMYKLLREGKLNVDAATASQAQKDIAEDGYWGVAQTSERLFSFAQALTGGDPSKAEEMKKAVMKGFEAAEKAWGGKLPDICQQTYDATMKKFDEWKTGGSSTTDKVTE